MLRSAVLAACLLTALPVAVAAKPPGLPTEPLSSGRERAPEDHEYYRSVNPPSLAFPLPAEGLPYHLTPAPAPHDWLTVFRRWVSEVEGWIR